MRLIGFILALGLCTGSGVGAEGRLPALDVVQSGHSLTDDIMAPLTQMVRATHVRGGKLDKATLPGSPMDWRWNNPTDPDIRQPGVIAQYDVLVLTERAPLSRTLPWHQSPEWALRWTTHAWRNGGLRTVLYATWVEIDSGPDAENLYNDPDGHIPFRDRLPIEMAGWRSILDHVNANLPQGVPKVSMIPGPLIMAAAYDDIAAGKAPGLSSISDLFTDQIHLNARGAYLIALAHYAVIYGADPRGLPHGIPARGEPDKAQAAWMQDLVWRVLEAYRATQ
ncbi:hypothetical protein [Aestuariivita boseongensis]|uniref:hypothetical protein n=1 Tax=Aestuariivita boseongensis TaxID=1470562 RepID=UPI0006815ABD|nr:hypothetical protein [Aestuariivita boseongensis]